MKSRPKELTFLAIFLLAVAVGLPVQVMVTYGHSPLEVGAIAAKLAPLNWLILMATPLTAWLIFRASTWVVLALPMLAGLVIYNNWVVAQVGINGPAWQMWLGTGIFLLGLAPVFSREVRLLIADPRRRWWLTPRRRRAELKLRMKLASGGREFYARTFDISEGGAFISFEHVVTSVMGFGDNGGLSKFYGMTQGTQCFISLPLKGLNMIQCRAEVVRNVPASGNYPSGIGVRFLGLSWQEKKLLSEFIDQMGAEKQATPMSLAA